MKFLNLSGNMQIDKINNFNYFKYNPKVESISISKIKFNKDNFNSFLKILSSNSRHLKILEINSTLLSRKYLMLFLINL